MQRSWYTNTQPYNSPDTIHQVLAFGTLDEIRQLKNTLGEEKIRELFLTYPKKVYTPAAFHFVVKFLLHISTPADEQNYLKYSPRQLR